MGREVREDVDKHLADPRWCLVETNTISSIVRPTQSKYPSIKNK